MRSGSPPILAGAGFVFRSAARGFATGAPVLEGLSRDEVYPGAAAATAGDGSGFVLHGGTTELHGLGVFPCTGELELATRTAYEGLAACTRGWHLARVWNFVPAINETGPGGLENYRLFCRARADQLERALGARYPGGLSAASAVGTDGDALVIAFAAFRDEPEAIENPEQLPAYRYPQDYGPRSPSFARASVARIGDERLVFISGTAAIKGHATVAPGDTASQLSVTLDNLGLIGARCGLPPALARDAAGARAFKVYLRHAEDLLLVRRRLEHELLRADDRVSYLRSDICRSELTVEIEATLRLPSCAVTR